MATIPVSPTGGDDQPALDRAARSVASTDCKGAVQLSGYYKLARPWVIGKPDDYTVPSVSLCGDETAVLNYVGPPINEPLVQIHGRMMSTQVRDLMIDCCGKCRGMLFSRQTYHAAIEGVRIRRFRQVGLDVISSWMTRLRGVDIRYGAGVGLRVVSCSGIALDQTVVTAVEGTDWPSPTDTSVVDHAGQYVQLKEANRCLVYLDNQGVQINGLAFESCDAGDRPLVLIKGLHYELGGVLYFEDNVANDCKVYIPGTAHDQGVYHFAFRNVVLKDREPSRSFIRTDRFISDISVDGIRAEGLQDAIILCDGGQHFGHRVTNCRTGNATIPRENWVRAISGAVLHDQAPEGLDHLATPITP